MRLDKNKQKEYDAKYYREHKEKKLAYNREYNRKKGRDAINKDLRKMIQRRLFGWAKIFDELGLNPICEICGKRMKWFHCLPGNLDFVCFDHKNGYSSIPKPTHWCKYNSPENQKNIDKFLAEDYGILCKICNVGLPTDLDKRKNTLKYLLKYTGRDNA